jgi:hypothetical protein
MVNGAILAAFQPVIEFPIFKTDWIQTQEESNR